VIARPVTWGAAEDGNRGTDAGPRRAEAVIARLRALGITHLMAPPPRHRTDEHRALTILREDTLGRWFDVIYEDYWVVVYRLRTGSASGDATSDQR